MCCGAGGTFVLRVEDKESEMMGCTYHYLTVRLMTPLYHPTVGPDGQIALWHHYEWDQRHAPWEIVSAFVQQLELDAPPILHLSMQTQLPPVQTPRCVSALRAARTRTRTTQTHTHAHAHVSCLPA
jgi:hypothetical protein